MRGRCENCYHAVPDEANPNALTCRLNPPVPHPIGGSWTASFAPVRPEWGCGQFTVRDMQVGGNAAASFSPAPYVPPPVDPMVERVARRLAATADEDGIDDDWRDFIDDAEDMIELVMPVENPEGPVDPA